MSYPWRCLWRGLAHTTYIRPLRRTILHVAQRDFIEAFTFILYLLYLSLKSSCYSRLAAVRVKLEEDLVPDQYFNPMQPHFARKITQHHLAALQRDFEQRIRQSILNDALYFWCFAIH